MYKIQPIGVAYQKLGNLNFASNASFQINLSISHHSRFQELRNTFEVEMEEKRQQYTRDGEEKAAKLRAALDAEKLNTASTYQELSEFRTR